MGSSDGSRYELFIRPLPLSFSYVALKGLFERFGEISRAEIRCDHAHAIAYVEFDSPFAALQAIYEVHGSPFFGKKLSVSWSRDSFKSFTTSYDIRIEQHPWSLDRTRIIALFESYGAVGVDVVSAVTTTAKAFAYVRFAQAEAAQRAIDELDGIDGDGQEIAVFWQSASTRPGKELIVHVLPFDISVRSLRNLFGQHGRLTNVHITRGSINGDHFAYAHVHFLHETDAERAIDALDGLMMSRGPIRIDWAKSSMPSGHVLRVVDLDDIDRKTLKKIFSRYGQLRRVHVDYDRSTGRLNRKAFVTFADRENVQVVLKDFDGYFFRNGEGCISLPTGRLNRELERAAAAEATPGSDAGGAAVPRAVIPDLLTDSVILPTASKEQADASTDLIDLSAPSPSLLPPAVDNEPSRKPLLSGEFSPAGVGYIYAEKREYEIPVHFYAVPENEKLEKALQILQAGINAEQDVNNNETDERNTKMTLVARGTGELMAAMGRINAAGIDCWMCDDTSVRGGHSFRPSEWTTVNVTTAPVCEKIKYSHHVVFLSPIDDPEDIGAAMDAMMLERTEVNLVSVLFDESDDEERLQVSHMMSLLC